MSKSNETYRELVEKILYRDYIYTEKCNAKLLQRILDDTDYEYYVNQGYTEEAIANELFQKIIKEICNDK